jgi:phenylpyruvate tautomerase PptA (4-oxalocrotonate tautomerase family)
MPLIQISNFLERTRDKKEAFSNAITNVAREIFNVRRPQCIMITYVQKPNENWNISENCCANEGNLEFK